MSYFVGHLIGDILLQNRWLARIKRKSFWGIAFHSVIAGGMPALLSGWGIVQTILSMTSHLLIDKFSLGKSYPDLINQGNPDNNEPAPLWLRLMADQIFHITCLYAIAQI